MTDSSRTEQVIHLAGYMPDFLKKVKEFEQLFETEQEELQRIYERLDSLWTDSFLQSAGPAGIKRFESLLGIRPYPEDSLDERRAAALLKWNQQLPYTAVRLIERLDAAVGKDSYELYVKHGIYEIELFVIDRTYRVLYSVRNMIREMVPANLLFIFAGLYPAKIPFDITVSSRLQLNSDFYARKNREFLYLDGTWLLDGTYLLNGYREIEALELYPARLMLTGSYDIASSCSIPAAGIITGIGGAPDTQTAVRFQGETIKSSENRNELTLQAGTKAGPESDFHLRVEKDLWYLDGSYLLDGTKLLDAGIFEYDL